MKKLFFAIVALAFVATSCSKDEAPEANQAAGATKTVTFSVNTPVMQTRPVAPTDGYGRDIDQLYYAFYEKVGDTYVRVDGISSLSADKEAIAVTYAYSTPVVLTPTLVVGKTYKAIFWAQSSKAPYTVSMPTALENAAVDMNYEELATYDMTIHDTDKYDAFYKMLDIVVTESYEGEDVLLYRPLAQLNIAVPQSDVTNGKNAGVDVKYGRVSIEKAHNVFNLATGEATGEQTLVFPWLGRNDANPVRTLNGVDCRIFSISYILLGTAENSTPKELTKVTYEMSERESDCDNDLDKIVRYFDGVPVQSNYRTYIVGEIVTGGATYNYTVQIDPNFDNEANPTIHPAQ